MAKWRKKPVVIEAEVYAAGMEDGADYWCSWYEMFLWCGERDACEECNQEHKQLRPYIKTLEGKHYITPGDYIITGVKGERYPCKPDIFAATYEPADAAADDGVGELVTAAKDLAMLYLDYNEVRCNMVCGAACVRHSYCRARPVAEAIKRLGGGGDG